MIPNEQTAGICGLFCGECPMYPEQCHGCLSDKLAPHCTPCPNGFKECVKTHGVTRCYECAAFPCQRLLSFLDTHWENGISHHGRIIDSLTRMKAVGVSAWVRESTARATCTQCGALKPWNMHDCPCKK